MAFDKIDTESPQLKLFLESEPGLGLVLQKAHGFLGPHHQWAKTASASAQLPSAPSHFLFTTVFHMYIYSTIANHSLHFSA